MNRNEAYLLSEGKDLCEIKLAKLSINNEIMKAAVKGRKEITVYFNRRETSPIKLRKLTDHFLQVKGFDVSVSDDFCFGLSITISWR